MDNIKMPKIVTSTLLASYPNIQRFLFEVLLRLEQCIEVSRKCDLSHQLSIFIGLSQCLINIAQPLNKYSKLETVSPYILKTAMGYLALNSQAYFKQLSLSGSDLSRWLCAFNDPVLSQYALFLKKTSLGLIIENPITLLVDSGVFSDLGSESVSGVDNGSGNTLLP